MKLILILIFFIPTFAMAQTVGEVTKMPIPRFVSLRGDVVYARTGPGTRYPIKWVYKRQGLPVEIVQEFDTWRKIRDIDGEEAWVHQSLLSGNRYAFVKSKNTLPIHRNNTDESRAIALVENGAMMRVSTCANAWCKVEAKGFKGWIPSVSLWGIYEGERIE